MLTRLKVSGFKNLVDVDVRFGAFTCIAGANGVGKSNLFDAIRFLSALADHTLLGAAQSVRNDSLNDGAIGRQSDVRSLFHRVGDSYDDLISFETEMIVPHDGVDSLGQRATASITFLRYKLELSYRYEDGRTTAGSLEIMKEELSHITKGDAPRNLLFSHDAKSWRDSVLIGERRVPFFISTDGEGKNRLIKLHQDKVGGRPYPRSATDLTKTVLSSVTAAESPTAALAQREMLSWRLLQLEPSALRRPDGFTAPSKIGSDGSHLASTLYHLARSQMSAVEKPEAALSDNVYTDVANKLALLIDDVRRVFVDRDERRDLFTLFVTGRDGTPHPARALSDGTLRFLALSVLSLDPNVQGVICLEEPENGIHPERIPAILQLLGDIAVDVNMPIGRENPLRQVIINTHSPSVVAQVEENDLLVAELRDTVRNGQHFQKIGFGPLPNTWRAKESGVRTVSLGRLLSYLYPNGQAPIETNSNGTPRRFKSSRVMDREDVQPLLPGF